MQAATKKPRVQVTFAGVTFSGFQHSDRHISVPVPALVKMLQRRAVAAHCCYDIEHDGNGEYDRFNQDVAAERLAAWCDRELGFLAPLGRPWLLYYEPTADGSGVVHYCPHCNLSYELTEVPHA